MVTVEQESIQSQVGNSNPQTQNPQTLAPTNLQPNSARSQSIQDVNPTSLFSNPKADAVIKISGTSGGSVESFLASESTSKDNNLFTTNTILVVGTAILIVAGSFLIIHKLLPNKLKS